MLKKELLFIQTLFSIINIEDYKSVTRILSESTIVWYESEPWGPHEVFIFKKLIEDMFLHSNRYTHFQLYSILSVLILKFKISFKIRIIYSCINLSYGYFQIIQYRKSWICLKQIRSNGCYSCFRIQCFWAAPRNRSSNIPGLVAKAI